MRSLLRNSEAEAQPLLSVVLPFHNYSSYLEGCIASVVNQLLASTEFELILVDDGSTDESTLVAQRASEMSSFISLHRLETNRGVSAARNLGISKAKGRWITFLDSDDALPDNALKKLASGIGLAEDAVFAGYEVIDAQGNSVRTFEGFDTTLDTLAAVKEVLKPESPYQGHVWGKAFKKAILDDHEIRFQESVSFYEDELFLLDYLSRVSRVRCVSEICYLYRRHSGQASDFSSVSQAFLNGFDVRWKIAISVGDRWPDAAGLAKAKYMLAVNSLVKRALISGDYSLIEIAKRKMRWDCFFPACGSLVGYPARQGKCVLSAALIAVPPFARLCCAAVRRKNK